MRRIPLLTFALVGLITATLGAQEPQDAEQIRSALSAAPASLTDVATLATFDGRTLREGGSDWVCLPDMPEVPNDSPMCLDANWREVIGAWQNRREPEYRGMGFGYMLQGDMPVSNTDPFAEGPTADNQWIQDGRPHIMVLVSDHAMLEGLPTDPDNGGPWVMWKGTPYAHIMIPTVPRRK